MNSNRKEMDVAGTVMDLVVLLAEGNPGAVNVLGGILRNHKANAFMRFLDLDDMNVRGSQIWVGYKDHCNQDLETFVKAVASRDGEMIATINRECAHAGGEIAVKHGGSSLGGRKLFDPSSPSRPPLRDEARRAGSSQRPARF